MSIEIRRLFYRYPASLRKILDGINLSIEKGEFVILAGPTGCGKSTLCRCLNGLIPHFYGGELEGEVIVAGYHVTETPISTLAQHVGLVFQNPETQLFALSVEKDVAFGLENLGTPREEMRARVDWALKTAGISELREKPPFDLSGGQQQRVAIASVLAMKPKIIVLDEPTSSLDPLAASKIFKMISELNRKLRITIILVEHRLDLATRYANRVLIMDDKGRIRFDGKCDEVLGLDEIPKGIPVPKVTLIYRRLKKRGILLDRVPLTPEEEASLIRRAISHDRS